MSFTVDGVKKEYTAFTAAHADTTGSNIELTILGAKTSNSVDDYFGIISIITREEEVFLQSPIMITQQSLQCSLPFKM